MNLRSYFKSPALVSSAALALAVTLAAMNHAPIIGVAAVLLFEGGRWWQAGDLNWGRVKSDCWQWLAGLASVVIITLNPVAVTQLVVGALYLLGRAWLLSHEPSEQYRLRAAGITEGAVFWAIFLAAAVWHWSELVVLPLVWASSWLAASQALEGSSDRAAGILSFTWALIAAECAWVFSLWLVNYILFNGLVIIPQPALVLSALGYSMAGIYVSHRRSQLSQARLIEYLMVGLVVLVIVIIGTKWNGVI